MEGVVSHDLDNKSLHCLLNSSQKWAGQLLLYHYLIVLQISFVVSASKHKIFALCVSCHLQ